MIITSEPSGATVVINDSWRGTTPYTLKFMHYGVYSIRMEMDGYYPMIVKEPIKAPYYQQTGTEFVSEVLVPKRISDVRELHYVLQKVESEDSKEDVMQRAEEMKQQVDATFKERQERDAERKPIHLPLPEKKKSAADKTEKKTDDVAEKTEKTDSTLSPTTAETTVEQPE